MSLVDSPALIQFIKYALAGVLATTIHIIIFHLVGWKIFPVLQENDPAVRFFKLPVRPIPDAIRAHNSMITNGIAFLIANMVAYVSNILWVFHGGKHHFIIEILLFYAVSGSSVVIGTMLMRTLIKRYGILTTTAFGANIFISLMLNYAMRRFFIFAG